MWSHPIAINNVLDTPVGEEGEEEILVAVAIHIVADITIIIRTMVEMVVAATVQIPLATMATAALMLVLEVVVVAVVVEVAVATTKEMELIFCYSYLPSLVSFFVPLA